MSRSAHLPNLICFTWHDAGDWFGAYGAGTVHTPHVDRLAAEGVRFANCHSACAICSPSRAALMTGRYCQRNGVMGLTNEVFDNRLHPSIPHLALRLRQRGYHTALLGVQHECAHEHVSEIIRPDERITTDPWPDGDRLAGEVARWIRGRAGRQGPFYAQIGTFDAHLGRFFSNRPAQPGEAYTPVQDTSRGLATPPYLLGSAADQACVATLQGQLRRGDRVMGAVLDALDESGLARDTLVVMNVDHGVGLDRAKTTCYDPGTKVAWILRWPGELPAGRVVEALATHVDFLPTLHELLGWPVPEGLDGCSLAGHARGGDLPEVRTEVFSHMVETTRSIRTRDWKLIRHFSPSRHANGRPGDCAHLHRGFPTPSLPARDPDQVPTPEVPALECFDLRQDPREGHNLAYDSAARGTVRDLDQRLWRFLCEQDDFVIHQPVRTPWQAATRRELEDYCRSVDRPPPPAAGPLWNP